MILVLTPPQSFYDALAESPYAERPRLCGRARRVLRFCLEIAVRQERAVRHWILVATLALGGWPERDRAESLRRPMLFGLPP